MARRVAVSYSRLRIERMPVQPPRLWAFPMDASRREMARPYRAASAACERSYIRQGYDSGPRISWKVGVLRS